jgi:DNA (cytosine-5)-methyltransferase 1
VELHVSGVVKHPRKSLNSLADMLRTLPALDRFGLVQWLDGEPTLRMLQVPELKRAMGLDSLQNLASEKVDFLMNHGSRRDKLKILGNGVCAPVWVR